MKLHSLTGTPGSAHRKMRVARGRASGKGKTAGRGHKGQMSRKGHKHKAGFEGGQMRLVRRIPKRGFTSGTKTIFIPVNVGDLSRFDNGTEVTVSVLKACGLAKGSGNAVKILGDGELSKKLVVKATAFSANARVKIEAAGGACEVVRD
jgi:large subunit ribosomal protein L15